MPAHSVSGHMVVSLAPPSWSHWNKVSRSLMKDNRRTYTSSLPTLGLLTRGGRDTPLTLRINCTRTIRSSTDRLDAIVTFVCITGWLLLQTSVVDGFTALVATCLRF